MNSQCEGCNNVGENWVCLCCGKVFCSRFVNSHMVAHNEATDHPLSIPEALQRSAATIQTLHAFDAARGVHIQPLPRVFYTRATRGNAQASEQAVAFTVPFAMVRELGARALEGVATGAVRPSPELLDDARAAATEAIATD